MRFSRTGSWDSFISGNGSGEREDFSYLIETRARPMSSCVFDTDKRFSMEHLRQEYPVFGTSDYRMPAVEVVQENGSRISELCYDGYRIEAGKPKLPGLPATYTEDGAEAETLVIMLRDKVSGLLAELSYTIFSEGGILARSVRFVNEGKKDLKLTTADLPGSAGQRL